MKMNKTPSSWVVYLMPIHKKIPMRAICDQKEWEAMELARPGFHTLVQAGIRSEAEAERIARNEPGIASGQR